MPLQNRVTPFGDLVAKPARGLLMGNRGGRIHDPVSRTLARRRWASTRWICCRLSFGERARQVWGRGYTELFFLDEVTALAAGHRPCAECRRTDARSFQACVARGLGLAAPPCLDEIDARLHRERLDGREQRRHRVLAPDLPDGAMVIVGGRVLALRDGRAFPWHPAGYGLPQPRPSSEVEALTPPLSLAALRAGYAPLWHPTGRA
jgi:hypothetical protein